jgi:hypothetical protein
LSGKRREGVEEGNLVAVLVAVRSVLGCFSAQFPAVFIVK